METCENGKKNTGMIAFRFRQVLLYHVLSICGTPAAIGTPTTVYLYAALIKRIEN